MACTSAGRSRRGRPLLETSVASFSPYCPDKVNVGSEGRGPLLLIMGGRDHAVPGAITRSTLRRCRHSSAVTDLEELDRGHCLANSDWREMAGQLVVKYLHVRAQRGLADG